MMPNQSSWNSSDRKSRLPSNWSSLRRRVLSRDHKVCQLKYKDCIRKATEVDHIVAGDDHSMDNLQAVCAWCHKLKSSMEGHKAKSVLRRLRKRPVEPHPGVRNPRT
jgi:5-methylcytosine-specific restriction protein A